MKKILLLLVVGLCLTTLHAQLVNTDFEQWDNPVSDGSNIPTGWVWSDGNILDPSFEFVHGANTDAQNGNYAVKLSVWYFYVKDMAVQTAPINYKPESLTGYYKYQDNYIVQTGVGTVVDTAQVSVYLTKYNPVTMQKDTIGSSVLSIHTSQSTFTQFTAPINYTSAEMPDEVTVMLDPSIVRRPGMDISYIHSEGFGETSYFTVDNLQLSSPLASENNIRETVQVYPNPTAGNLYITNYTGKVSVFNSAGQVIMANCSVSPTLPLSLSNLKKGMYYIELVTNDKIQYQKVVKL